MSRFVRQQQSLAEVHVRTEGHAQSGFVPLTARRIFFRYHRRRIRDRRTLHGNNVKNIVIVQIIVVRTDVARIGNVCRVNLVRDDPFHFVFAVRFRHRVPLVRAFDLQMQPSVGQRIHYPQPVVRENFPVICRSVIRSFRITGAAVREIYKNHQCAQIGPGVGGLVRIDHRPHSEPRRRLFKIKSYHPISSAYRSM